MATRVGSLATISCKPRQARKGATVAVSSGAEVWLVRVATPICEYWRLANYYADRHAIA